MRVKGFHYEYFNGLNDKGKVDENYKERNFVKTFLEGRKSFLTSNSEDVVLTSKNIDAVINALKKYKEDRSKYNDNLKEKKTDKSNKPSIQSIDNNQKIVLLHAVWLWAYPAGLNLENRFNTYFANNSESADLKIIEAYKSNNVKVYGIGAGTSQKNDDIEFILNYFKEVCCDRSSNQSDLGQSYCDRYKNKGPETENYQYEKRFSRNILLHLFNADEYEPYGKQSDKEAIVKAFGSYKNKKELKDLLNNIDTSIMEIRQILENLKSEIKGSPLWENGLEAFYKESTSQELLDQFCYKKAIMLYGPPGTGKTFEAKELAKQLFAHEYSKAYRNASSNEDKKKILEKYLKLKTDDNIISLQFHINYTYDDFIAGMVIKNHETIVNKGKIFEIIDKAKNTTEPIVVILDEVNRTDISRVFGELFSAIEYRETDIDLSLKNPNGETVKLNVPKNIYFVGTMNEIDFSLERIDFALRRRFIWILKTFEEEKLNAIMHQKIDAYSSNDDFKSHFIDDNKDNDDIDNVIENTINEYCTCCKNLNNVIKNPELGEKYYIGHAFFAEIIEIIKEMDYSFVEAKKMLWKVSIKPTIEAYCGSMDKSTADNIVNACGIAFGVINTKDKDATKTKGNDS